MRELTILYDGPGLVGRTTSIRQVAKMLDGARYFAQRPHDGPSCPHAVIACESVRLTAKSIVGPRLDLELEAQFRASADAIVFIADSQPERRETNEEARDSLVSAYEPDAMPPVVLQLNKRDLPELTGVSTLARLFPNAPRFQSVAPKGIGIWDAFAAAALLAAERRDLVTEVRALLARRRESPHS